MADTENLLKEINRKGLPTEISTLVIMESKQYSAISQLAFVDQDSGELRSIDFMAIKYKFKNYDIENNDLVHAKVKLYIECKKSENASLVFYRSKSLLDPVMKQELLNPEKRSVLAYTSYNHYGVSQQPTGELYKYASLYDIIGKKKDFLLEAQMQLLKAIKYHEKFIERKNTLVIPLVIFNGKMYEYSTSNVEEKIAEISFISYLSNGLPFDPTPIRIDVVTLDAFPDYLDVVSKILDEIIETE